MDPACAITLSRRKVLFSGLKFINMTLFDNDSRENSKICSPPAARPNSKEVVTGPRALKTAPGPCYTFELWASAATRTRISNKSSIRTDSRISQSNYRNLADRRQKMLSLGDPYFRSLDFSNIYSFEFFPWYHNSLAFNITTDEKVKCVQWPKLFLLSGW